MHSRDHDSPEPVDLADETVATVRRWLDSSTRQTVTRRTTGRAAFAGRDKDRFAERLLHLLGNADGVDFATGFVDRVVRPEDLRVAGRNLERLSHRTPAVLPWYLRWGILVGGGFGAVLPWQVMPIVCRVFRRMVGRLVLDATPKRLETSLKALRGSGIRLNLSLLGESVLGDGAADRRLADARDLLARDDVDCISIAMSAVAGQPSLWAFDETVENVVDRLTPLYEFAADTPSGKFINLDVEDFRDLNLGVAVFERLLERPELRGLEAGITLPACLRDAMAALQELAEWATRRRAAGGAGIKIRLVKGTNFEVERVRARLHGWPLASYPTRLETDTNYKRMLGWSLTPERTDAVRIGVASHNLFDIAYIWLLATARGVDRRVEFEMLLGMIAPAADAVKQDVGGLLLCAPVVPPGELDSAGAYLIRLFREAADSESFLSASLELAGNERIFAREADRFRASLAELDDTAQTSHRVQDRAATPRILGADAETTGFSNTPDTDPALAANRRWARAILDRIPVSSAGSALLQQSRIVDADALQQSIANAVLAGEGWGQRRGSTRAQVLHSAGESLAARRATLIEVMASETGKIIADGDGEASQVVDFAHYYAERARELDSVENAQFVPSRLIVVASAWNSPIASAAASVLAALGAGSGVILIPDRLARRSAAVLVEALWDGGVPRDVVRLVDIDDRELDRRLITHPSVDRVILAGTRETASLFRSWRSDLPLLASSGGRNSIIVTPSADLDRAVTDVVASAFGNAGQAPTAAGLVILVGSVVESERFHRQLIDAVSTLRVGYPQDAATTLGPIIEDAHGESLSALTVLGEGERWLIEPHRLDESGRLWSPGVRDSVAPGSEFHLTVHSAPVLGIMQAATLTEAVELQNAPASGLAAGIHSLDPREVAEWLATVEAGNLYVNRDTTSAVVRRQPFGGWKRSALGTVTKTGGPNSLVPLGDWEPVFAEPRSSVVLKGIGDRVTRLIEAAEPGMEFLEFDRVRTAARSDQKAWESEFGGSRDASGLGVERNVLRYLPVPVTIRLADGASAAQLVRAIVAATLAGAPIAISSAVPVAARLIQLFGDESSPLRVTEVIIETDARWYARVQSGQVTTSRIRLLGGDRLVLARVLDRNLDITVYAGQVTTAGRIELLPFLREQAVSITAHRFGHPDPAFAALVV